MSAHENATFDEATRALVRKYRVTSWFYDILDYPWERQYRRWRPSLLAEVSGTVLEAGVGTGRNLRHYPPGADVTAFDLSPSMVRIATKRARKAACRVSVLCQDATRAAMSAVESFRLVHLDIHVLCPAGPFTAVGAGGNGSGSQAGRQFQNPRNALLERTAAVEATEAICTFRREGVRCQIRSPHPGTPARGRPNRNIRSPFPESGHLSLDRRIEETGTTGRGSAGGEDDAILRVNSNPVPYSRVKRKSRCGRRDTIGPGDRAARQDSSRRSLSG